MSILLLSNDQRLRKAVKNALAPRKVTARKVTTDTAPQSADAIVTTAAISSATSFLAMQLGTPWVFVLPEAVAALGQFVDREACSPPESTERTILVGSDASKIDALVRADLKGGEQEVIL